MKDKCQVDNAVNNVKKAEKTLRETHDLIRPSIMSNQSMSTPNNMTSERPAYPSRSSNGDFECLKDVANPYRSRTGSC